MPVPRSMVAALLAALLLGPSLGLAQGLFRYGDPCMTVTDPGQATLVAGPKKGAPTLAAGDKVFVHSVAAGWATVELDESDAMPASAHRYRLPFAALASQPGKTFPSRPAWAPAPGDPALAERDVAAYEDDSWIMVREGAAKPRRIAKGRTPAVSPDASLVAYAPQDGGGIVVVDTAGQAKPRPIATKPADVREIHFAPDSRRLAWRVDDRRVVGETLEQRDRIEAVELTAPAAKPAVLVTGLPVDASFQGFGRDGQSLIVFAYDGDNSQLRRLGPDGKILSQEPVSTFTDAILPSSADTYLPSPANDTLLLAGTGVRPTPAMTPWLNDSGSALFLCDLGSGTNYRLTPRQLVAVFPAWTPDGQRIYFTGLPESPANGTHHLYRMNADGTGLTDLGKGFAPSVGTRP